MKTGLILKDKLGLSNLKYISLCRVLITTYRIYLVFYNTRYSNTPITSSVLRDPMPSMTYIAPFDKKPLLGPLVNIEDFNGQLELSIFFAIDLAGQLNDKNKLTRIIENVNILDLFPSEYIDINTKDVYKLIDYYEEIIGYYKALRNKRILYVPIYQNNKKEKVSIMKYAIYKDTLKKIYEELNGFIYFNLKHLNEITIPDIKKNATSNLNKKFLSQRKKEGNTGSYLQTVDWNEKDDTIFITFFVTPTFDTSVINYDSSGNQYTDTKYIIQIEFMNVSKYLGDRETYKKFMPSEQGKIVLDMLDNADVKLWSSDPSFLFQSSWEYFDEIDSAIYPLPVPKGQNIWANRHKGTAISGLHGTKHLSEIFEVIKNNYSLISSKLRNL